jgi:ParB family chromosome partitioning protein
MWLDAIKRQGQRTDLTSRQVGDKSKSVAAISAEVDDSSRQIHRFIRLNELIPELKDMVDNAVINDKTKPTIAFTPAVELSYLSEEQQRDLLMTMESEDRTPSLSQAQQMKMLSAEGKLDMDTTFAIMNVEKPNQVEQFKLPRDRIRQFIPKGFDDKKLEEVIVKLLEDWYRKRERSRDEAR